MHGETDKVRVLRVAVESRCRRPPPFGFGPGATQRNCAGVAFYVARADNAARARRNRWRDLAPGCTAQGAGIRDERGGGRAARGDVNRVYGQRQGADEQQWQWQGRHERVAGGVGGVVASAPTVDYGGAAWARSRL